MKYNIQERLDKATEQACEEFHIAMLRKLLEAQVKHGYTDDWKRWDANDMRRALREHVEKGDPRDVANIAMFLWACGQATV